MKTSLASLALMTGLGLAFAGGAHAQTASGTYFVTDSATGGGIYNVQVAATGGPTSNSFAGYTYTYVTKLLSSSDNAYVNTFTFTGIPGLVPGSASEMGSGFTGLLPPTQSTKSISFSADPMMGLHNVGDTATFSFNSLLPPGGLVSLTPAADTTPDQLGAGKGAPVLGPGVAAVPEPASLALLGLGALPLGLIARRRKAKLS